MLKLRDGRFAAYGHLKTGSVRVRRGQSVRAGEVLGQVGNTGQSGGPHLHFQLSDGPDPIASEGVPHAFDRFTLIGTVTNIDEFLSGAANADIQPLNPDPGGARKCRCTRRWCASQADPEPATARRRPTACPTARHAA